MKEKLCVLTGPTGIGKTKLSLDIAEELDAEIISADSMQIYKYMDIGTAKVDSSEASRIPHHLIDIVYPDEEFSVSDFMKKAKSKITDINSRGKLPLLVGGTGLYINSLVYDLNFAKTAYDEEVREKYENLANEYGLDYVHNLLEDIDPERAKKIHENDIKRVIRALEIYELTGKTMSEYNKDFRKENTDYDLTMICLNMDRQELYNHINKRVDKMVEKGLIDEVKKLLDMGYDPESTALQGIGYKELISYLDGEISLDDSLALIKQKSRNYAKRQLTWFRRDNRFKWVDKDSFDDYESLKNHIKDEITK